MPQISVSSLLGNTGPNYAEAIVAPYREELTRAGFEQLLTPAAVDQALERKDGKTVLLVLNSVCGCSARVARPGAILSLLHGVIPDLRVTLFAGMEKDAVTHFREKYLRELTPSSPNIAIFSNGELKHILHRYQIERMSAEEIANELTNQYNSLCSRQQTTEERAMLQMMLAEKYQGDLVFTNTQ
jgi:putative YphP/YqiW family bacilliredoxin